MNSQAKIKKHKYASVLFGLDGTIPDRSSTVSREARATLLIEFCRTLWWTHELLRRLRRLRKVLRDMFLALNFPLRAHVIWNWMRHRRMQEEERKRREITKTMKRLRKTKKK